MADEITLAEPTEVIRARLLSRWDAWKNRDAVTHNSFLTDDYCAVPPDGQIWSGKPTPEQITEAQIDSYQLAGLLVKAMGVDCALVTYIAEVWNANDYSAHTVFAAGEVWVNSESGWLCRYYQGTALSRTRS